ncbi:MAG: hypothetical protein QNJ09_17455 [Paracoccaceae bacterium]|nr:hypothetical protein [Paracoccaceae bacterium]
MKHSGFPDVSAASLRPIEQRLIGLLRDWQDGEDGQNRVWSTLCRDMGTDRARGCLNALEDMLALLRRHGWRVPAFLPPGTEAYSADEADMARFVFAATEQRREEALEQAMLLVSPAGLMDLTRCAERIGLPLLCADCRARVRQAQTGRGLTFQ